LNESAKWWAAADWRCAATPLCSIGSYIESSEGTPIKMTEDTVSQDHGRFNIAEIAGSFPATSKTLLIDRYLTDREGGSARVFRVYTATPPHYHAKSDEYLYVFSGRGTFWMKDASTQAEFGPGDLLFFQRGTVHALPDLFEEPVVFLAIDAPRRDPKDIIFVNAGDGTPESFIAAAPLR
jgi:mannose-6-phosphate isomerase-like protein (cupin superfamily)